MGDIDRVQQLANTAKLINAFQRVNPADGRHPPRKDHPNPEDQADKLELSQEEAEPDAEENPVAPVENLDDD